MISNGREASALLLLPHTCSQTHAGPILCVVLGFAIPLFRLKLEVVLHNHCSQYYLGLHQA